MEARGLEVSWFGVIVEVVVGGRTLCWRRWDFIQSTFATLCLIFPASVLYPSVLRFSHTACLRCSRLLYFWCSESR